jgi:D-alanyl-D-alanine carboxypeptidase
VFVKNLFLVAGIILLGSFITIRMEEFMARRNLVSPVLGVSKEKISENIWTPKVEKTTLNEFADAPEITSIAALFVDTKTGQVLYEKNPRQELPIASLNKIMTTIVALENRNLDDTFSVSKQAAEVEPDKMFLIPGEKMTLKELLDGIFLVSANDAAEVIAENTSGRRKPGN